MVWAKRSRRLDAPVAPSDLPWLTASATELAAAIHDRTVTSVAVVDAHIRRIQAVNGQINAIVQARFEAARDEAHAADAAIADGQTDLPPLFGVPCTIKESFGVTGMKQTSGLVARAENVATSDATAVARLRGAGAIVLGTSNVSELLMWLESDNRVYGRTNNPYHLGRIAGGSSGGEGAIVGAGGSPFGLGADVGGSIRLPAFFNGVFGHKPTGGLVPNTGQYPLAENEALNYLATGPIARRAEDLMTLLRILAGPDGQDISTRQIELGDANAVDLRKVKVLVVPGNGAQRVSRPLLRAQKRAADALQQRGATIEETEIPELKRSFDIWSQSMSAADDTSFRSLLGNGEPVPLLSSYRDLILRRGVHTLPALILATVEKMPLFVPADPGPMVRFGQRLRDRLRDRLGDDTVLLYPPYTRAAPRHRAPVFRPFDFTYTGVFNALSMPSTQVPIGVDAEGLPLGVQVVGGHFQDHLTIAVATALERSIGGWIPPWMIARR